MTRITIHYKDNYRHSILLPLKASSLDANLDLGAVSALQKRFNAGNDIYFDVESKYTNFILSQLANWQFSYGIAEL